MLSAGPASWTRRSVLARSAGLTAASLAGWPAPASAAPYENSLDYRLRRINSRWLWRRGCKLDQWPHTAIDGGGIIAGWGDGWGAQRPDGEAKSAIGFTRFTGQPSAPAVSDLWSDSQDRAIRALSLKPQALLTVGGAHELHPKGSARTPT